MSYPRGIMVTTTKGNVMINEEVSLNLSNKNYSIILNGNDKSLTFDMYPSDDNEEEGCNYTLLLSVEDLVELISDKGMGWV